MEPATRSTPGDAFTFAQVACPEATGRWGASTRIKGFWHQLDPGSLRSARMDCYSRGGAISDSSSTFRQTQHFVDIHPPWSSEKWGTSRSPSG